MNSPFFTEAVVPSFGANTSEDGPDDVTTPIINISVIAGRVSTLQIGAPEDIQSVRILDKPDTGNLTVNPDNSLALVLSHPSARDFEGTLNFSYEVTYSDGRVETVSTTANVTPSPQLGGWGEGDHYMLQTDAEGELVVEHGDNHRKVHISGSDQALSLTDIAAREGMDVEDITESWLANSTYGTTPETALDDEAGMMVWRELTGRDTDPGSHWLLFERGYEYEVGRLIDRGAEGESELHPLQVTSYGDGDLPVLNGGLRIFQSDSHNIVIRDVAFGDFFQILQGSNYLLDGIDNNGNEMSIQNRGGGFTLRDSIVTDSHQDTPSDDGDFWRANQDRVQGIYINDAAGVLLENNFFDLNGFELDYSYDRSTDFGQAPSMFNHNIYIGRDASDVTLRDSIMLRGASFGAQVRPGGFIEDNVFAGNNIGVNFLGGNRISGTDTYTGNYTLFADNLVTSGGFHTVDSFQGATTWGVSPSGRLYSLVDNIIAHLVEPGTALDVPDEYDVTQSTQAIVNQSIRNFYTNDTIVYNWALPDGDGNTPDANVNGLDPAALDQITIENFTAQLLSQTDASLEDLAAYLRAQTRDGLPELVDADVIIAFFQQGFGISSGAGDRAASTTLRFVPDDAGDGIRWDNRRNWDTEDLPGTAANDSVDLAGNWVVYGGTTQINNLILGDGGALMANHGYLQVDGAISSGATGGQLDIDSAGQIWINGYSDNDLLDVNVDGGRFANTGRADGHLDIDVTDNGQALLATSGAEMTLAAGSSLSITGSDADVGFDGGDGAVAVLRIESGARVDFVADADGFSTITEFRSGHYTTNAPNVTSGIALNGGTLGIDLSALSGSALTDTLIAADQIIGSFDQVELLGLAANRDASLTVDYETDTISFNVTATGAGNGQAFITLSGDADASNLTGGVGNEVLYGDGLDLGTVADVSAQVYRLYDTLLDRSADYAGHASWTARIIEGRQTVEEVAAGFTNSDEFQAVYGGVSTAEYVELLYENALGRSGGAGATNWTNAINNGLLTREDVALRFSESQEAINNTRTDSTSFIEARSEAVWVDDVIYLYEATLGRTPDRAGLEDWVERLGNGQDFQSVVSGFVNSTEFQNRFGSTTDSEFVTLLYTNVLGRTPSASEVQGWTSRMNEGSSREDVVIGFTQSSEFRTNVAADLESYVRDLGVYDVLNGGAGTNTLIGGAFSDEFVFDATDSGTHRVLDLEAWDTLVFEDFGYTSDADVRAHLNQVGDDVVFADQGVTITLQNVALGDITDSMLLPV